MPSKHPVAELAINAVCGACAPECDDRWSPRASAPTRLSTGRRIQEYVFYDQIFTVKTLNQISSILSQDFGAIKPFRMQT
jgi:hypothetical protein